MSKLTLSGVSKAYGATVALSDGALEVAAGEVHVLMGANGSGKSTLCKIVAGSVRPDRGVVSIDGRPVTIRGPGAARALGIGVFYQELSLAAHRTVADNICLADLPTAAGVLIDRKALQARAARYIAMFDSVAGDGFAADATVADLRADQRQLVEIMKTLASEAPILLFDEPTSALDRAQVERLFEIVRALKAEGRAMVFISHRMDEIFAIGDRVTVIRDGRTIGTARLADTDPATIIRQMVGEGEAADLPPEGEGGAQRRKGDAETDSMSSGIAESARTSPFRPVGAPSPSGGRRDEVALSVRGLTGPGFAAIDLDVRRGEILGFGGLHGQGQSAVLRALFGALPVAAGDVQLAGRKLRPRTPREAIRRGIAYVSGDRRRDGVLPGRPILENLTPIHALRRRLVLARASALRQVVRPVVEALHTRFASLSQPIDALSGGNQQKIVIARWLIDRPDVLLLDDPTKGIDLAAKADLFAQIRALAAAGMAIVLYSSEDAELLGNADPILVFNGGRIGGVLSGAARTRYNLYHAAYEAA
ncbi:sugar ABC transporter ATP-binding protein [Vineibacter terrae]|uniref:sugar ABC transporter ATP-binding protein n=1 Tax=Vineibacter terrae TaxID=2586908 RepID=UPI002E30D854|nr:sugar ABC transporter ATP-binding protein [Vineibacter terrae]HEX2887029.1 sugar ABC transporter ATP-binding protein [Vineibacter terrae]